MKKLKAVIAMLLCLVIPNIFVSCDKEDAEDDNLQLLVGSWFAIDTYYYSDDNGYSAMGQIVTYITLYKNGFCEYKKDVLRGPEEEYSFKGTYQVDDNLLTIISSPEEYLIISEFYFNSDGYLVFDKSEYHRQN